MSDVESTRASHAYGGYEPVDHHEYDEVHHRTSAGNAATAEAGRRVLRAGSQYDGEFERQKFRNGMARTERLDAAGLDAAELHVDADGLARDGHGDLLDSSGVADFGGNRPASEALFARSAADGKLRTRNPRVDLGDGLPAITHHTTVTDGAGALSAGTAHFDQGHLTRLTDQSGHFRPPAEAIFDEVQKLKADGLSMRDERPVVDPAMQSEVARLEGELAGTSDAARRTELVGQLDAIRRHLEHRNTPTKVSLQPKDHLMGPMTEHFDDMSGAFYNDRTLTEEQFSQTGGDERLIRTKDMVLRELRRTMARRDGSGAGADHGAVVQRQERPADLPSESGSPNRTGLPDELKAGVERLSGLSMDDVRVHYGSDKPAQLNALAYAQGTDIHLAPGQEEHLPHEAWHVVQQAQGRVRPTLQMKDAIINDDSALEREADAMGEHAIQGKAASGPLEATGEG